jgi:hypothetical protein
MSADFIMPIAMGVTGGLFVIFAGQLAILHSQQLEQFGTTRRGKLAARVMDWPIWAIRRVLFGEVSDLVTTAKAFRVLDGLLRAWVSCKY